VILPAELIPSGQHDPLLKGLERRPAGLHEVVLSASAAERLKVTKGAVLQASLSRQYQARHERVLLDLQVVDVASERAFTRPAVFASLEVLMAAEAFRDGRAVPALGWSGDPPLAEERVFPSFRLYAGTIYEVAGLASVLTEAGQRVKTAAAEIETVRSIDRNLGLLFWVIAAAGMAGYSLSLGASLWANTDRKRRELSVLRLLGFRGGGIMLYPSFHALFTAVLGWLGAVFVYLLLEQIINRMLAADLAAGQSICFLMPRHFFAALFLTLIASLLGAVLGGVRAARIEPSDGLREV
jgi:putative ABC transport system permease protein